MREKVSPVVVAVVIVVALAAVSFFGYRTVTGGNKSGVSDAAKPPTATQSQRMGQQYQNYGQSRGGSSTGSMGGGYPSPGGQSGGYPTPGGSTGAYPGR